MSAKKLQLYEWHYGKADTGLIQVFAYSLEQAQALVLVEDESAHASIRNVPPKVTRLCPMVLSR